jgi:purine-binding chemotaxis protein CheW
MSEQTEIESAADATQTGITAQFVGFRINEQEFAFPIEKIQEILVLQRVTRIPQVGDYVEGVTNLRGTIIPVINLRKLFGMEEGSSEKESRTIVVNVGDKTLGCRVDSVSQVLRVPREAIQPAPEMIAGEDNRYVSGIAKLDDRLVVVLDSDELLDPEKLDQVQASALSSITAEEN